MTITWVMLRRRRARGYMIWSRGRRAVHHLQALADGEGRAERVLDVRALADGPHVPAVSASAG